MNGRHHLVFFSLDIYAYLDEAWSLINECLSCFLEFMAFDVNLANKSNNPYHGLLMFGKMPE